MCMMLVIKFSEVTTNEIATFSLMVAIILIISLALREILRHKVSDRFKSFMTVINVFIVFLLIFFILMVLYRVMILL